MISGMVEGLEQRLAQNPRDADRWVMLMTGGETIRDAMAFPKASNGKDLMMDSPGDIDEKQLRELHIRLRQKVETQVEISQS